MTIYTPSHNEKDNAKDKLVPEVVTEPLTGLKDVEKEPSPKPVRVTYFPKRRRPFCFYMSFVLAVMVILACGITAGVFFYRHMTKKEYTGWCAAKFYDPEFHKMVDEEPQPMFGSDESAPLRDQVQEDIKVSEVEMYEELHTPRFDEVMESIVVHEFSTNFTTLIDNNFNRCFVMALDHSAIAPPPVVIDLLKKLVEGFQLPKARVLRETYFSSFEAVVDLEPYGPRVVHSCRLFTTFWIEKKPYKSHLFDDMFDDFGFHDDLENLMYAMLSNRWDDPAVFKLNIRPLARGKRPAAPAA